MKLILLFAFFLYSTVTSAQNSAALLKEIDTLTVQKQFSKAIPLAEQYVQLVTKEAGDNHRTYLEAVYRLAILYSRVNNTEKAGPLFEKYLQASLKLYGENSADYARALSNTAIFHVRHDNNAKGVEFYLRSLAISSKIPGSELDNAATLRNLGYSYNVLKDFKKAEEAYKKAAEIRKVKAGEQSWEYEEVLYDLAELYYNSGNYKEALPVLQSAANIIKQLAGVNSGEYAYSLNFAGDIYMRLQDVKNAEINYTEAIKVFKEKYGTDNEDYAELLSDLPVVYALEKKIKEAETLFREVLLIRKKIAGENNTSYLQSLNALGNFYIEQRLYGDALTVYRQGLDISKKMFGTENKDYDYFLFNVAYCSASLDDTANAASTYTQVLALRKKLYGENSRQYALALNNMGVLYLDLNKYEQAEPWLLQAEQIRKQVLGTDHIDYWQSVSNLAKLYMKKKELEKSESLYLQAHKWYEKNLESNKKNYVLSLHRIAILYTDMPGKKQEALNWFAKAIPLEKELFGEDAMYVDDLIVVGNIYKASGEYGKAEGQYRQAIKLTLDVPGQKPQFMAKAMNIMGRFYKEYGLYNKADSFFKASTNYTISAFTKNSVAYANALVNEASLYIAAGEYNKAEPLLLRSEEIIKRISGKDNLDYFTTALHLALIYQKLSQWEKTIDIMSPALDAKSVHGLTDYDLYLQVTVPYLMYGKDYTGVEKMYFEVLKVLQDNGDQNNERYTKLQNDLTDIYIQSAQYDKAQALIITVLQESVKFLKPGHHEYARAVFNQGRLDIYKKQFERAEHNFLKALELRKQSLGVNHPDHITTMRMLGSLYLMKNEWQKGIDVLIKTEDLLHQNLLKNFSVLSEKEKGRAVEDVMAYHEIMNNAAASSPGDTSLIRHNLNSTLLLKSLALASTRGVLDAVRSSSDKEVQQLVKQWEDSKNFLGRQYALPKSLRIVAIDSLEKRVEGLEKELTRRSADFRKVQNNTVRYHDVQKNLKPDEALIEFVRFAGFKAGEERYGAYLLKKHDPVPTFIPLFFEKNLEQLFSRLGKSTTAMVSSLYRGAASQDDNITVTKGDSLYTLIWRPLEKYLSGIKTIAYSPAGKLYTVAFQALPVDSNVVLMDKYTLQQYTSTRLIASRTERAVTKPKSAVLFGDAQFSVAPLQKTPKENNVFTTNSIPGNRGGTTTWSSLPGTAEEVKKLRQLFADNAITTNTFTQQQSNEEALKGLSGRSPQLLHIATHGFFLPGNKNETLDPGNVYASAEDPLLRSGLVFSGANHAWSGKPPVQGAEDGIATAYEISQIDLSGTELVVLSACETALGAVQGSEGVFGLQRGFKMAGVKKMIVSLWQVPDKETAELMTLFYTNWLSGKTIEEAFRFAQAEMRKKYSPFYWAAFTLIR